MQGGNFHGLLSPFVWCINSIYSLICTFHAYSSKRHNHMLLYEPFAPDSTLLPQRSNVERRRIVAGSAILTQLTCQRFARRYQRARAKCKHIVDVPTYLMHKRRSELIVFIWEQVDLEISDCCCDNECVGLGDAMGEGAVATTNSPHTFDMSSPSLLFYAIPSTTIFFVSSSWVRPSPLPRCPRRCFLWRARTSQTEETPRAAVGRSPSNLHRPRRRRR